MDDTALRVMICEDEAIIAMDLKLIVEDLGYTVIGPFPTVSQGLNACSAHEVDAAILDVQLRDGEVFPVAQSLHDRGTAIIFQSGHAYEDELSAKYPASKFCPKPIQVDVLVNHLRAIA